MQSQTTITRTYATLASTGSIALQTYCDRLLAANTPDAPIVPYFLKAA